MKESHPRKMVAFDSGMSVVDPITLPYLAKTRAAKLEVVSISGVGESYPQTGAKNAARLLKLADSADVPIGIGPTESMVRGYRFPPFIRAIAGSMLFVPLPEADISQTEDAISLLANEILSSPEKMSIVITGPATNIGRLLQSHPEVISNIKEIVMMAGAVEVPGNSGDFGNNKLNPAVEWNVGVDPLAVKIIWESQIPITLVPLDATNSIILDEALHTKLTSHFHTPVAQFISHYVNRLWFMSRLAHKTLPLWDPATAVVGTEEQVGKYEDMNLSVIADPADWDFGRTVIDSNGTTIKVCVEIDPEKFTEYLAKGLGIE